MNKDITVTNLPYVETNYDDVAREEEIVDKPFTYICKSNKEIYPSQFAIYARIIEETDDSVTLDRFQKWGAVHCGVITISHEDFNKYYKRL